MSEKVRLLSHFLLLNFGSNIRDLSHMRAFGPHIECSKGRAFLNGRNIFPSSINTVGTVGFHLATRTSTAVWNERDASCI
jgi:hypothetical protein